MGEKLHRDSSNYHYNSLINNIHHDFTQATALLDKMFFRQPQILKPRQLLYVNSDTFIIEIWSHAEGEAYCNTNHNHISYIHSWSANCHSNVDSNNFIENAMKCAPM